MFLAFAKDWVKFHLYSGFVSNVRLIDVLCVILLLHSCDQSTD